MRKRKDGAGENSEETVQEGTFGLARAFTRKALVLLFLSVFFLSVLVAGEISWTALIHSLIKGILAASLGWAFLLIVSDALARSIAASAIEAKVARQEGGLLYHFLPPGSEESGERPPQGKKSGGGKPDE